MRLEAREAFLQGGSLSNLDDLVVYLNNVLPHYNYSIPAIERSVGLSKDFLGGKLRNSSYTKVKGKNGLIVRNSEASTPTIAKSTITQVPATDKTTAPTDKFVSYTNFIELSNEVAELKLLVQALQGNPTNINLDINSKSEATTTKTMRLYSSTLDRLDKFCKLHPQYSKYDIISHIIDNFIDNFEAK